MMSRCWRRATVAIGLAIAGVCAAPLRGATIQDVIGMVPSDASVVVAVGNLRSTSEKVASVHAAVRSGMPELANLLDQWQQRTGFVQGIDASGPAAAALVGGPDDPLSAWLLLTATNFEQFAAASGAGGTGEIVTLKTPDGRTPAARSVAPFALITPDAAAARRYQRPDAAGAWAGQLSDAEAQCIERSAVVILIDVPRCATPLRVLAATWISQLYPSDFERDPLVYRVYDALRALGHTGTDHTLDRAARIVVGLDVDADALQATCVITFRDDSDMANRPAAATGSGPRNLLGHLPDAPILFAASMDTRALPWSAMLGASARQLASDGIGMLRALHTGAEQRWDGVERHAMVIFDTRPATDVSADLRIVRLEEGADSAAMLTDVRALVEGAGGRTIDLGEQRYSLTAQYLENAQRIRQVGVDRFTLQFDRPARVETVDKVAQSVLAATAATGQRGYVAAVDQRMLAFTNATDSRFINAVVEAAKSGQALGRNETWQATRRATAAEDAHLEMLLAAPLITTLLGGAATEGGTATRARTRAPDDPHAEAPRAAGPLGISVTAGDRQWTVRAAASMGLLIEISDTMSARDGTHPGGPGGFFPGGRAPR